MEKQEKAVDDQSWVSLGSNLSTGICNQQMRSIIKLRCIVRKIAVIA
jgi:hypothetical protein